jgi:hypothetical protein
MWLGLAHFHNGYSFLMISPNLLDIFLILSHCETAHFLIVFRPSGDGYSLLGSKNNRLVRVWLVTCRLGTGKTISFFTV